MRIAVVLCVASAVVSLSAQDPQPGPSATVFEVASIRLNKDGGSLAGLRRLPGGRFEATNIQLAALISFAHRLQPFELQGGPPWLTNDRWDILARLNGDPPPALPGATTPDANMLATQALLADRFKLSMRREMRDIEVPQENLDAASLFTVLQEQLGLKPQSSRMPMPVMVIDRVERPVED